MANEQVEVSERFRRSLLTRIRKLQDDAANDERTIAGLRCEDHQRRQRLLVQTQLEDAFRLTDLLSLTRFRQATTARTPANDRSQTTEGA
jgi:hypothetical protein